MKGIERIKSNQSDVYIGRDVFKVLNEFLRPYKESTKFLFVDENVLEFCVTELITSCPILQDIEIIEIESGEENKNLDICYQIWKTLSEFKADRNMLFINLGGGVVSDMGGFIASTYKRGVDFINIPTTLLSQVDASIGGKVGVDFEGLKNQIGLFREPKAVFVYPGFLNTLDKRQVLSGYAEVIKHALIQDADYWTLLKEREITDFGNWDDIITRSVQIKNNIVLEDPLEKGLRKALNFGHTIGHAIESYSLENDKLPLLHGEAVAMGMLCEVYISNQLTGLSKDEMEDIYQHILSLYSPYSLEGDQFHHLIELMKNDKKNESNGINFTLLSSIGNVEINTEVEVDIIIDALNYFQSYANKLISN